jgi:hypothetical protein
MVSDVLLLSSLNKIRPDRSRHRRRCGYPASCHRPSAGEDPGADPAAPPTTRGEGDRCAATTAAAAGDLTRARKGRSEAASADDGAAGKVNLKNSYKANTK